MSTQTVIICDRCKDEITPGQQRETTLYTKRVVDLCPECQRLFTLFLQGSALTTSPEDWARDAAKQFEDFQPDPEGQVPERTAKVVEGLAEEDPWDLDETCPMHGVKRGRIEVPSRDYIPEPGCTCQILYPDTCRECYGEKARHKMDCSKMSHSPSALSTITTAQWRAVQDRYEPLVNEVNEARRMRRRLDRLIEQQDNQALEVTRGILTTAQLRHAISGDLEVTDAASPE